MDPLKTFEQDENKKCVNGHCVYEGWIDERIWCLKICVSLNWIEKRCPVTFVTFVKDILHSSNDLYKKSKGGTKERKISLVSP